MHQDENHTRRKGREEEGEKKSGVVRAQRALRESASPVKVHQLKPNSNTLKVFELGFFSMRLTYKHLYFNFL